MTRLRTVLVIALAAILAMPVAPAMALARQQRAERSVVSAGDLDVALQRAVRDEDAQRRTIRALLARPDVREFAAGAGLDLRRADSAISTLEGDQLRELAAQAVAVDRMLAGGAQTVTISLVTLLLIIIIIILLAD